MSKDDKFDQIKNELISFDAKIETSIMESAPYHHIGALKSIRTMLRETFIKHGIEFPAMKKARSL